MTEVVEVVLQKLSAVEWWSRLTLRDTPFFALEDTYIEIVSADGGRRELKRDELIFRESPMREGLIAFLDGSQLDTTVEGLRLGDCVRWTQVYRLQAAHGIPQFVFGGSSEPVVTTRLDLSHPASWNVRAGLSGREDLEARVEYHRTEENGRVHSSWSAGDWPPEAHEEYVPAGFGATVRWTAHLLDDGRNSRPRMHCGPDWSAVGTAYLAQIEPLLEADARLATRAREICGDAAGQDESVRRLFECMQRDYRYLGLFEGRGGIIPEEPRVTFDRGFGDCKGLSAVLIVMLRSVGVRADPVLLRSAQTGLLDPDVPSLMQMNHFIVFAETTDAEEGAGGYWLDPTTDGFVAGVVPVVDCLSPVLLLRSNETRLVEIPDSSWMPEPQRVHARVGISPEGILQGQWRLSWTHSEAAHIRLAASSFGNLIPAMAEFAVPTALGFVRIDDVRARGLEEWRDPLEVEFRVTTQRPLPRVGGSWLLPVTAAPRPLLSGLDGERQNPLDLRLLAGLDETLEIELGDFRLLNSLTEDSLSHSGAVWKRRVTLVEPTKLEIQHHLRWPTAIVPAHEAKGLAAFVEAWSQREAVYLQLGAGESIE